MLNYKTNSQRLLTLTLLNLSKINSVQLACVRHTPNVHSEPGSNSLISCAIKNIIILNENFITPVFILNIRNQKGVMGFEPMTNRVTDYYSSSELYFIPL